MQLKRHNEMTCQVGNGVRSARLLSVAPPSFLHPNKNPGALVPFTRYMLNAMCAGSVPNRRQLMNTCLSVLRMATTPRFSASSCLCAMDGW